MEQKAKGSAMKISGWIFLLLSWGLIIFLSVFSFYKILTKKKVD